MFKSLGFDPDKDFSIVSGTPSGVLPVVVQQSVGLQPQGVRRYAQGKPVKFGSWAPGSAAHLRPGAERKVRAQDEVVNYKGEAPMWQEMGSGSLQAAMGSPQAMNALLVKGEIKPIVAPGRVRAGKLPDLSPGVEQGFTDEAFNLRGWLALSAPPATPKPIVQKMRISGWPRRTPSPAAR